MPRRAAPQNKTHPADLIHPDALIRETENLQAIELLLTGHTVTKTAQILEIDRRTLQRRINTPEFQALLREVRAENRSAFRDRLDRAANIGIDVLVEFARDYDAPATARVQAGSKLTEAGLRHLEYADDTAALAAEGARESLRAKIDRIKAQANIVDVESVEVVEASAVEAAPVERRKAAR